MEFTGEKFIPSDELSNQEIGIEHLHRYHSILNLIKGKVVLDIACGEGYGSALIAKTAETVYGVDIDAESINHASVKYKAAKPGALHFLQGTVDQIPLPDHVIDIVISFETIEHVDENIQQQFMKEVKRVLKPGGILIISTPDKANYSDRYEHKNEFHIKEFNRPEFLEFIGKNFTFARFFDQGYDIVSAITETDPLMVKELSVCNWDRPQKTFARKYLLAIASNESIQDEQTFASVVFQVDRDYQEIMDRLVEKEAHIIELGAWGKKLDGELLIAGNQIKEVQRQHQQSLDRIAEMETHILELGAWGKKLDVEIADAQNKISIDQDMIEKLSFLNKKSGEQVNELQKLLSENIKHAAELIGSIAVSQKHVNELHLVLGEKDTSILELKGEVKTTTALYLDAEKKLEEKNTLLQNQGAIIENQYAVIDQLESKNNQAGKEVSRLNNEIADKNNILQEVNGKLGALYRQNDKLNDTIAEIYDSEGYKLLSRYYRLRNWALPEKSRRYTVIKKIVNKIRGKNISTGAYPVQNTSPVSVQQPQNPVAIKKEPEIYLPFEFTVFTSPKVSIIVPAHNGWEINYKCLRSISENTQGTSYEVIFADDGSTDDTQHIDDYIKNIVHIRNEHNLGFLKNCNNAATFARGEYLHFLNNDTEVTTGWLSSLVKLMESNPAIGITGSKLVYPDGRLQEAGGIIWKDASGWNYGHKQDPDHPMFNYVKEVDYISGASIMIRNDLWKQIGGFDTRYSPAYFEDTDLAFAVRAKGYKVVYQPLSKIIHYEGYSHGSDINGQLMEGSIKNYQAVNKIKFLEKWSAVLEKDHFANSEHVFWARDRSRHKKTILVIDHYVPHFDRDAGSRHTFQYLKLMLDMNMNVKFLGDNFYRHEPYTTVLQEAGIEVLYGEVFKNGWKEWLCENKSNIDYIYLNRPHISIKYIDFIKENTDCKIIYFGHDLHYYREEKQYEIEKNETLLVSAAKWKKTEMYLFEKSDLIITPSEKEKEIIKGLNGSFKVSVIPLLYFKESNNQIADFTKREHIIFVGGFNHTPNVDAIIWFIREIWPVIKASIPEMKFFIIGSNVPDEIKNLESPDIIVKGYVTDSKLESLYRQIRMAVIPLRYGAGTKGKTLEAMQHGIPIITTPEGIEGMPGDLSFFEPNNNPAAFAKQLVRLYSSVDELCILSRFETEYIKTYFSQQVAKKIFQEILV